MKILVTGGTGFLGRKLGKKLVQKGFDVHIVTRNPQKHAGLMPFPCQFVSWDHLSSYVKEHEILHVIHLAGESVAGQRWSSRVKKEILDSRVQATLQLLKAYESSGVQMESFISASAIGYYGDRGEEALEESASQGVGFLSDVCVEWEKEVQKAALKFPQVRICNLRIGVVLGQDGGALEKMIPPFRDGYGAALASGQQWMSWIHVDDLTEMFCWTLNTKNAKGIYNAVSPEPVRNVELSKKLASFYKTMLLPKVPKFALSVLFGEMSQVLISSQNVLPSKFKNEGFAFQYSNLDLALKNILVPLEAFERQLNFEVWVPHKAEALFSFFENENNLEKLTPPWLHFKVLNKSTNKIEKGTFINYSITLHGIPMKWQALIKEFKVNEYFIDSQIQGPYKIWHHTHTFEPLSNGTIVGDVLRYKIKMSALGFAATSWKVDKDVLEIFKYRAQKIRTLFK